MNVKKLTGHAVLAIIVIGLLFLYSRKAKADELPEAPRILCIPEPAAVCPVAISAPAFWTITRTTTGALNLTAMNDPANLAGQAIAGELCGDAAASKDYYLLPRLATGGRVPLAKCQ